MLIVLILAGKVSNMKVEYINCPPIPPRAGMDKQFGLAGPVSGADGSFVMVAGGANFEGNPPWKGGIKIYHDDIFLLSQKADGSLSWSMSETKLPFPLAYSACITLKDGFVSLGGENSGGPLKAAFRFTFNRGAVKIDRLPDLPEELSAAGATLAGNRIFVAGGLNKTGESRAFYALSLVAQNDGWKRLPDLPVKLSHIVCVMQNDGKGEAIYVIGGRNKTGELSTIFSSVYKFSLSDQKWTLEGDIRINNEVLRTSAGTGMAFGRDKILLFSGDRGILFNQSEKFNLDIAGETDAAKKDLLIKKKIEFLENHPGFSNQILTYNVLSKSWSCLGDIPGKAPVTTVAFSWKGKIVIPSGEIRPGVRTDRVVIFSVKE